MSLKCVGSKLHARVVAGCRLDSHDTKCVLRVAEVSCLQKLWQVVGKSCTVQSSLM